MDSDEEEEDLFDERDEYARSQSSSQGQSQSSSQPSIKSPEKGPAAKVTISGEDRDLLISSKQKLKVKQTCALLKGRKCKF